MTITYKDAQGVEGMRVACKLASEVLDYITPFIKPGITTNDIDRLASECMALQGSINPVLARFGEASEARQYSGRAVLDTWACPFKKGGSGHAV